MLARFLFVFACALGLLPGSLTWGQVADDFEGTYTTQTAPGAGGVFSGLVAPGWLPSDGDWTSNGLYDEVAGVSGSAQQIATTGGEGYLAKAFTVTPDKYIRVKIWIKTSNYAGDNPANTSSWIEYGWDPTGQTATGWASSVYWHKDEGDAPKHNLGANYNTWTEYTMPDTWVLLSPGSSVSVWLKCGSVGSGGIRGDFDDLTIEELDTPPGGVTPGDFPDNFDGTYSAGLAPEWMPRALPGGSDIHREEATGRTGEAQRLRTLDADIGVVRLFNAPTLTNLRLTVWAQTATAGGGDPFSLGGTRAIMIGYDRTGQILDMGAETIEWDESIGQAGSTPFENWTEFLTSSFFLRTGEDTISVWLRAVGSFSSAGTRAEFDDLDVYDLGPISGAEGWELYR